MKMIKVLLAGGLMLAASATMAFPTTASTGGMRYYKTGVPAPAQYLVDSNVIKDYHHYHLHQPTDGYEWVHGNDNDYLLVSIKTGIVRSIENRPNIPPEK